jgi:hypothetical protein
VDLVKVLVSGERERFEVSTIPVSSLHVSVKDLVIQLSDVSQLFKDPQGFLLFIVHLSLLDIEADEFLMSIYDDIDTLHLLVPSLLLHLSKDTVLLINLAVEQFDLQQHHSF